MESWEGKLGYNCRMKLPLAEDDAWSFRGPLLGALGRLHIPHIFPLQSCNGLLFPHILIKRASTSVLLNNVKRFPIHIDLPNRFWQIQDRNQISGLTGCHPSAMTITSATICDHYKRYGMNRILEERNNPD